MSNSRSPNSEDAPEDAPEDASGAATLNEASVKAISPTDPRADVALGCAATILSVAITCVLLFFNASFVMALIKLLEPVLPIWARTAGATQFLLFLIPVILLVAEWMLIDFIRSRFRVTKPH
ncbi:hypothetical protein Q31b_23580 [Novipirellula aureliae]|uniref:Uncharacterized protein n=1 Tax=Novipirellula aureliae TaxID=2527966 RepID=A0A5C6E7X3_9BACT|nr:hypothetical protein [Novipirellula aureliae]TWU43319.1 hypothetical protein Q31b_23580 [Novipirellula aureliae]